MNKAPKYLYNYVSTVNQSYQVKSGDKFLHMCCRTEYAICKYAIGKLFPSVHNQEVESNLEVWKIVNQYRMRFLKIHY